MKLVVLLVAAVISAAASAATAPDLNSLTGWYKTDASHPVYIGVFDQETCISMLKIGTPGVCVKLTFSTGNDWWNVVQSASSVILSGPYKTEKECRARILSSGVCLQAQMTKET